MLTIFLLLITAVWGEKMKCPFLKLTFDDKQNDRMYGQLTLTTKEKEIGVSLRIKLDKPVDLLGVNNNFGGVKTEDNTNFYITNNDIILERRSAVYVHFFVKFNAVFIPEVTEIILNGKIICPPGQLRKPIGSNKIPETFNRDSNKITDNEVSYLPDVLIINNQTYIRSTTEISKKHFGLRTIEDDDDYEDSEEIEITNEPDCGTVAYHPEPLISNGQFTKEGQWPWHAALYKLDLTKGSLTYTCGGTLISKKYIITAAHCVTFENTEKTFEPTQLLTYLGKYSLNAFGSKIQNVGVSKINLHPKYNHSNYFNDIAILELSEPIQYTDWVRPSCLWENGTSLRNIIRSEIQGTVIGWGYNNISLVSESLTQAKMPVVSNRRCIESNQDLSRYVSGTSFCAGYRNGTTVCHGDSGGGMFFSENEGNREVWFLRGLVSHGFAMPFNKFCSHRNDEQFIIFTDVAKHLTWIKSILIS